MKNILLYQEKAYQNPILVTFKGVCTGINPTIGIEKFFKYHSKIRMRTIDVALSADLNDCALPTKFTLSYFSLYTEYLPLLTSIFLTDSSLFTLILINFSNLFIPIIFSRIVRLSLFINENNFTTILLSLSI